jgi:hypothetical protein
VFRSELGLVGDFLVNRLLVRWSDENVRVRHASGRDKKNADLRSFISKDEAERATGITQQQVSRCASVCVMSRDIESASPEPRDVNSR